MNHNPPDELKRLDELLPAQASSLPTSTSDEGFREPVEDGVPVSPDEYNCPVCHDSGWYRVVVPLGHPNFGKAVLCEACATRPKPAGIPDRLQGKTFADFDVSLNKSMAAAKLRCQRLAEGQEWCAVLVGPPGVGKSHLAVAVLHATGGYFWETGDLLRRMQAECFGEMGPHTPQMEVLARWQDYRSPLVLDDMGAEKWTEWSAQTLYAILNARYQRQLPTIITTNVADSIDDRLLSRYYEGAIQCAGQDVRRLKRWPGQ